MNVCIQPYFADFTYFADFYDFADFADLFLNVDVLEYFCFSISQHNFEFPTKTSQRQTICINIWKHIFLPTKKLDQNRNMLFDRCAR